MSSPAGPWLGETPDRKDLYMRRTLALVTAVTLSISAACGDDSSDAGDSDGGSATGEPGDPQEPELSTDLAGWEIIEESSTEPFTVDEPIWGSDSDDAAQFVTNAAFHDDWAILLGGDEDMATHRLEVVDLAAGELSWSLDEFDDDELPGGDGARLWLPSESDNRPPIVVDEVDGADWAVLVSYTKREGEGQKEHGVAALAGETGEVLWMSPVIPATEERRDDVVYDLIGNDEVVVALTHIDHTSETYELVALDPSDGEDLWEGSDLAARGRELGLFNLTLAGDTILAQMPNEGDGGQSTADDQLPEETVVAWGAATGETRWDLGDRYPLSQAVVAADDVALVQVPAEPVEDDSDEVTGPAEMIVLEASTGEEVTSLGTFASRCVADRDATIACHHGGLDPRYATFGVEDRDPGLSVERAEGPTLIGVHGEYLFVSEPDGVNLILDRSGGVLDDDPPGGFVAMSDRYAIFTAGDLEPLSRSHQYTIYPLSL